MRCHSLVAGAVVAAIGCAFAGFAAGQAVTAVAPGTPGTPVVFPNPSLDPTKPAVGKVRWYWPTHARNHARAQQGNVDLCFLGDSVTQGWPGDLFAKYYGPLKAVNFGCGGDKIQHMLMRLEGDDGELNGISPKVVVLLIGINNTGELTPEQTAYGIDYAVKYIQKKVPTSKVLLLGLLPGAGGADPKVVAVNQIIAKLDNGKTVRFLDMSPKFLDRDGKILPGVLNDAVHPSRKGYEIWGETMAPLLKEMMQP